MKRRHIVWLSFALVGLAAVIGLAFLAFKSGGGVGAEQQTRDVAGEVNLLQNGQWGFLPGTSREAGGLRVRQVGLDLVNPDGSFAEHNPPVNLYGTRLEAHGDFRVSATFGELNGAGALTLYGEVPTVLDEQRFEAESVRMVLHKGTLHVGVTSGQDGSYVVQQRFAFTPEAQNRLAITLKSNTLSFAINGRTLGDLPAHDVFAKNELWFGLDTTGSMLVTGLRARALGGGTLRTIDTSSLRVTSHDPNGLQQLAKQKRPDLKIGTAVSLEPLVANPAYAERLGGGWFGGITTENALKAETVHPLPNVYNFAGGDALVDFARRHNLAVHGHALVFGETNPRWMQDLAATNPQALKAVMLDHIKTVVGHYKGKMSSWDVVNEAFDDENLNHHIWYKTMGEGYIAAAFRAAHEADPNARLFINEFGLEGAAGDPNDAKWHAFLALIDRLQAEHVPIHGVGFQTHIDTPDDRPNLAIFQSRMRQLAARGLQVRISELDVYGDDTKAQTQIFADLLRLCMSEKNCVDFSTWGIGEGNGATAWVEDGQLETAPNLPFDTQMRPRQPAKALQAVLGTSD